ncbi:MAG: hypothetical protein ACREGJ_03190 [Candidatus Saccharimonadales bacterium]
MIKKLGALLKPTRTNLIIAVSVAAIVLVAGYFLMQTNAAGFFVAHEVEQGSLSGNANIISDSGASNGKAVQFTAPAAPPPPPPPPPPSGGSGCLTKPSGCGYPDATNTGVPAGTKLTPSGGLTLKTPGQVISNLDVLGDVAVYAANVTIKNSRITNNGNTVAAIRLYDGASVTIEDSEVDGKTAKVAIGYGNFTLRRVNMRGGVDAVRADGNVTIVDSYIHDLERIPDSHNDILQTIQGSNITVKHNTLFAFKDTPGSWPSSGDPMNAIYQFGNFIGNSSNILVENNLVNGGNYSFNANWLNVDAGKSSVSGIRIINNKFGRDFRYGPAASMSHGIQFTGNVYVDTGKSL